MNQIADKPPEQPPPMPRDEARRLTEKVKGNLAELWTDLLRLYEGEAWRSLGYDSWPSYCREEFAVGRSQAYRLLDAGRVVEALAESPIGDESAELPSHEGVARELAPVLKQDGKRKLRLVWNRAREEYGPQPTAAQTRQTVRTVYQPEEVPRPSDSDWRVGMTPELRIALALRDVQRRVADIQGQLRAARLDAAGRKRIAPEIATLRDQVKRLPTE